MRTAGWICSLGAGLALLLTPCVAFAQNSEGEPAAVIKWVLEHTKNAEGVFVTKGEGRAAHIQSGMTCPAYLQNAFLSEVLVFDSTAGVGADVGCDYARRTNPGSTKAAAKHTLFAVKLPKGWTLDDAFSQYQAEMHQSAPKDAKSGGQSLHFDDPPKGYPEFRSEEMFYNKDGRPWQTEVIVAVVNGWIIEVRSTRASQYALASPEEGVDQTVGVSLFFRAINDLGGPSFNPSFQIQRPNSEKAPAASQ